jgi:hypothetical protein
MKKQTTEAAINTRTAWRPILKPVARLLIAAQLALVLQPLSVLAQEKGQAPVNPAAQAQLTRLAQWDQTIQQAKARTAAAAKSPADQVSEKLSHAEELVAKLKRAGTPDKPAKHQQLKALLGDIRDGTAHVRSEFAATRAALVAKKLPAEIVQRHDQAVAQFEQRSAQFNQSAGKPDDQMIEELAAFFGKYPAKKRHTPIEPGKLPWGSPKATPRMPAETKTAWYQRLTKDHKVQLAQAGGITTIGGVGFTHPPEPTQAPQDADLAETPDVQLTPAIRAKAQELGNNPVAISNWVHNNIQWLPTWGSIQGADGTLKTLRGNAFDTASLTIALLRASGIPARYQFGTIDVPVEKAMNWVGGVQRPEAALNLMYQGGIAARAIASGGRIITIRMEHVWVNAYVNWTPSRGNRQGGNTVAPPVLAPHGQAQHPNPNGALNAWVPVDGSFKQYTYTQGMDLKTAVPFDAEALLAAARLGATVTADYAQNLNQAGIQSELAAYQNRLRNAIESTLGANATVGDVIGVQTVRAQSQALLAGTTPHPVVVLGNERAELPESLRWRAALELYMSNTDRANESPAWRLVRPLAALTGRRVSLVYEPSASADQQVIDAALANGQTSFAAYLVRMTPKLKLEEDLLAVGPSAAVGQEHYLRVTVVGPREELPRDYALTAGEVSAVVFNPAGVTASLFNARTSQFDLMQAGELHSYVPEMLHQIGLGWWAEKFAFEDVLGTQMGVLRYSLPSHARLAAALQVRYSFGVARSASYRGHLMDGKLDYIAMQAKSGAVDAAERLQFARAVGQVGSLLEGAVFDQAFLREQPKGVSSISLLTTANSQGIPVYQLTPANASLVWGLNIHPDVKEEIAQALAIGRHVTVSRDEVTHWGYRGVGYIIEDPLDGSAAYQIDGGLSGGGGDGVVSVIPFPAMAFTSVIGILLGPSLRQLGATLLVDSAGQLVGVGFLAQAVPVPAPVPDARVAALIATILAILSAMQSALDQKYPKYDIPLALVKYSNGNIAQSNFDNKMIRASRGGTFGGDVVYLALASDPVVRSVLPGLPDCPPTELQRLGLAGLYQLSDDGNPPYFPDRAEAFVYFELTREGVYNEQFKFNSNGVVEVIIPSNRMIPGFVFPEDGLPRLYIGTWAPAIENLMICR